MADGDPTRIDPRYDAAFQRGFAGEIRTGPLTDSALRRAIVSSVPERVAASPAAPGSPRAPIVDAPDPSGPEGAPAGLSAAAGEPADEPASARDVTRNPFYLAAAGLAVLLIVGGAVWLNQGFTAIAADRDATNVGYYAAMAMSFGAPMLIGIGIAIVAGLLFVLARGWRPRDERS